MQWQKTYGAPERLGGALGRIHRQADLADRSGSRARCHSETASPFMAPRPPAPPPPPPKSASGSKIGHQVTRQPSHRASARVHRIQRAAQSEQQRAERRRHRGRQQRVADASTVNALQASLIMPTARDDPLAEAGAR